MARPVDNSLQYFPFDVDFFADRKIKIVKARYGADGIILYIYLLCEIYRDKGYYAVVDDDFDYILSAELNMTPEKIGQMMNFLLERSLFNDILFKSDKVLTSAGIQRRYQLGIRSKAVKRSVKVNEKFWILQPEETQSFIEVHHFVDKSEKNADKSTKKSFKSKKNNTKESKVNKNKEKQSKYSSPPLSEIYALFNRICTNLTPVQDIPNASRERAVLNIWNAYEDMEKIKTVFTKAQKSDFLSGKTKGWKASFDWLMKQENFVKVYEGNYDNQKSSGVVGECSYDMDAYERMLNTVPTLD